MKFIVKRYYSGYCTHEVDAENSDKAYEMAKNLPLEENELLATMEEWIECDEVEPATD